MIHVCSPVCLLYCITTSHDLYHSKIYFRSHSFSLHMTFSPVSFSPPIDAPQMLQSYYRIRSGCHFTWLCWRCIFKTLIFESIKLPQIPNKFYGIEMIAFLCAPFNTYTSGKWPAGGRLWDKCLLQLWVPGNHYGWIAMPHSKDIGHNS